MEQDNFDGQQEEVKPKNKSPFHAFIPKGDYFFTPIILNINILVFVLMIISGVHPMTPSGESLSDWGANRLSLTTGGQPWRLFTSMFLHFGIIHLAVNMLALYNIGSALEPFIGRTRFLLLYIFSGLGGSAVSLWWHAGDASVSAGASGAIFGLFGIFAALLTTDLINPAVRKDMLISMSKAIVLNLLIGLYGGIDNAAHIGGLLTGAAGGYLCYFDLRSWYRDHIQKYRGLIVTGVLTAGAIVFFWMILPKPIVEGKEDIDVLFERYDAERIAAFQFAETVDSATTLQEINTNMTKRWEHCMAILDSIKPKVKSDEGVKYIEQMQKSTLWGVEAAKYYQRSVTEHKKDFVDSGIIMLNKQSSTFNELNNQSETKEK